MHLCPVTVIYDEHEILNATGSVGIIGSNRFLINHSATVLASELDRTTRQPVQDLRNSLRIHD